MPHLEINQLKEYSQKNPQENTMKKSRTAE
jgi:hypothetical protein